MITNHAEGEQTNQPALLKLKSLAIALLCCALFISTSAQAVKLSKVSTLLNTAQKLHLEVDNKPLYITSIQIRLDKLRDTYGFNAAARESVIAKAASDGFNTVSFPFNGMKWCQQKTRLTGKSLMSTLALPRNMVSSWS